MEAVVATNPKQVCAAVRSKTDTSAALGMGWSRMIAKHGRGGFADQLGVDAATVKRAMCGDTTPELHTVLNSLMVDQTALNELFALYGFEPPRKRNPAAANDLTTLAGLSEVLRTFCAALEDGDRNHVETLALADACRNVMPALSAIMGEAARIRGLAA